MATWSIKSEKWEKEDVESVVSPRSENFSEKKGTGTEVLVLASGEGVRLVHGSDVLGMGMRIERLDGEGDGNGNGNGDERIEEVGTKDIGEVY